MQRWGCSVSTSSARATRPLRTQQFVNLPKNIAVKSAFLKSHPEVAEWMRTGPLANMPTLYREFVHGTMLKYAKTGVGGTYSGVRTTSAALLSSAKYGTAKHVEASAST
jgi:hypothetical protein